MSLELFAIGSSGLALVAIIVMILTRFYDLPVSEEGKPPQNAKRSGPYGF